MAKSKCPVCSVRVPAVAGPWKRLCTKHEDCFASFPVHKFTEDDAVLVRGNMIKHEDEDESIFEDEREDCFA